MSGGKTGGGSGSFLKFNPNAAVTVSQGNVTEGSSSWVMSVEHNLAAINSSLQDIKYIPFLNFNGYETFIFRLKDHFVEDARGFVIQVDAVNDAPIISLMNVVSSHKNNFSTDVLMARISRIGASCLQMMTGCKALKISSIISATSTPWTLLSRSAALLSTMLKKILTPLCTFKSTWLTPELNCRTSILEILSKCGTKFDFLTVPPTVLFSWTRPLTVTSSSFSLVPSSPSSLPWTLSPWFLTRTTSVTLTCVSTSTTTASLAKVCHSLLSSTWPSWWRAMSWAAVCLKAASITYRQLSAQLSVAVLPKIASQLLSVNQ